MLDKKIEIEKFRNFLDTYRHIGFTREDIEHILSRHDFADRKHLIKRFKILYRTTLEQIRKEAHEEIRKAKKGDVILWNEAEGIVKNLGKIDIDKSIDKILEISRRHKVGV